MDVISVCSGAGGMDLGFHRAECRTVALCEADPWRRRLLARHWPGVPCWPDLTTLDPAELPRADVLIGGTPCQDLSHAGRRAGLDAARSGLFWDYCRVRNALGIEWAIWENVEGALSSNQGLDFACVLGAFVGADVAVPSGGWPGAGVAAGPWGGCVWRVLDAQHFGVPQRRRRVFVVGRLGGECPPEVLLEPAGGCRDSQARGGQGPRVAASLTRGSAGPGVSEPGRRQEDDANLVVHTLTSAGFDASEDGTGRGTPLVADRVREADELADGLDVAPMTCAVDLQPDGRRYAACGDGVVANVAEWIARRLMLASEGRDD